MKVDEFKKEMIAFLNSFSDWYALERHANKEYCPEGWPEEMTFDDWREQLMSFDMGWIK